MREIKCHMPKLKPNHELLAIDSRLRNDLHDGHIEVFWTFFGATADVSA
jgi:hypothetical protein